MEQEQKEKALEALGKRVKALRIAQGYDNYETFAFEKNINRTQYGRYERGQDIRYSSLVKLAKAFNMTLVEFFAEGFDD